ncbi:MspA family porin [Tsukamurella pseudospumae]|uniref:MspA family protein n=1 Tax=Tsukamurella pseudospumae TaxID=239498 RepID=A0A137YTE4_9ACTN|nr:MspA family porin [Tsukamurella pseudospumae]KXO89147.1 hypothetical protein AXK61_11065 [Tsukamurella pseudospumae]
MKKLALRGAAVAAVAGVALGAVSTGTANADTFLNLDNPTLTQKLGDGSVTISLTGHHAILSPGMVALPTTRNAWVSGTVSVKVNGKASGGTIQAGYVVGCQIQVGNAGVKISGKVDPGVGLDSSKGFTMNPTATASTGASLSLGAGQVGVQNLTFDRKKFPSPGDEIKPNWSVPSNSYSFSKDKGSLSFQDQTIGVDNCGGYAQAKFYALINAQVGNSEGNVILWGKPFTLG